MGGFANNEDIARFRTPLLRPQSETLMIAMGVFVICHMLFVPLQSIAAIPQGAYTAISHCFYRNKLMILGRFRYAVESL